MKNTLHKLYAVAFLTIMCWMVSMVGGCMVIWGNDVFVATLFKTVDANDLDIIAEPNYFQIGSGDSETENDSVKLKALVGGVPVILESD